MAELSTFGDVDPKSFIYGKLLIMVSWKNTSCDENLLVTNKIRALVSYVYESFAVHIQWFVTGNVVKINLTRDDMFLYEQIKEYVAKKASELGLSIQNE